MASLEESLVLLSSTGDRSAEREIDLAALVERHATLLYRVAYSVLRSSSEAEDVVQDAFVRVLERPEALAAVRDDRVWLVRIAWNLSLDRIRRRRTRPEAEPEFLDALIAPGASAERAIEEAREIQAALIEIERLPARERQVLLLASLEELDTTEIAAVIGRSEAAVRGLLFRARNRLRERLRERLEKAGYR